MGKLKNEQNLSSRLLKFSSFFISLMMILFFLGCDYQENSLEEKNKSLIISLIEEGINNQNLKIFDELLSPDYVRYSQAMPPELEEIRGIETYKNLAKDHFIAFPDYKEEFQQIIAEGDKVSIITKGTATHTGPMGEIAPTNKKVIIMNFGLFRIKDGKIVEMWVSWDNVAFLRQLGLFPTPKMQDKE
jgi:predicted ester cyclase